MYELENASKPFFSYFFFSPLARGVVPVDYCFWVVSLFRIERIREQFEKDSRKGGKRESKRARTFGFCFCFSAPTPIPSTTWEEQRNQRFRCDLLSLIRKRKVPRARRRSDLARRIQKRRSCGLLYLGCEFISDRENPRAI